MNNPEFDQLNSLYSSWTKKRSSYDGYDYYKLGDDIDGDLSDMIGSGQLDMEEAKRKADEQRKKERESIFLHRVLNYAGVSNRGALTRAHLNLAVRKAAADGFFASEKIGARKIIEFFREIDLSPAKKPTAKPKFSIDSYFKNHSGYLCRVVRVFTNLREDVFGISGYQTVYSLIKSRGRENNELHLEKTNMLESDMANLTPIRKTESNWGVIARAFSQHPRTRIFFPCN